MNIAVIDLIIFQEGFEKMYNVQPIGLGRAISEQGHCVNVLCLEKRKVDFIDRKNSLLTISHIACRSIGSDAYGFIHKIPTQLDAIVCFSDNKYGLKSVEKFCKNHRIQLFPYVGIIQSTSTSFIIRLLKKHWEQLNVNICKQHYVFAKTIYVKDELLQRNVKNVFVTPVGLDMSRFKTDIQPEDRTEIRSSLGFDDRTKALLFISRLEEEKRPLVALEMFNNLYKKDSNYRLVMIGKGYLEKKVKKYIYMHGLQNVVHHFLTVLNVEMWKYYVACDCSLNLNLHEIFGMSILEAMYYECPVVAHVAPGPNMIISNEKEGYIFKDDANALGLIEKAIEIGRLPEAHQKIANTFTWKETAKIMINKIQKYNEK
jgi:1,2-diacylglycerol 3-alpha-glucosyltransferase